MENDSDPEGQPLTVTDFSSVSNGELVVKSNGIFEYTPDSDFVGTDSFSYTISDGEGGSDSANVTITVNEPPELINNTGIVVEKSSGIRFITDDNLQASDADNTPGELIYTIADAPDLGELRIGSSPRLREGDTFTQQDINDNLLQFTPDDAAGNDFFSYTVADTSGGQVPLTSFSIGITDDAKTLTNEADNFTGTALSNNILGLAGDDSIDGLSSSDYISGDEGNDSIFGNSGDDCLSGGTQQDTLRGGDGSDSVFGGEGNDSISGDTGNDRLFGEAGNDNLLGGDGGDSIIGGEGNDSILGADGGDTIAGNAGNDTIRSGVDNDSVTGGEGSDLIDGGPDNDTISSGAGSDTVVGGSENDSIFGEDGDDSIVGDDGNDTIDGGSGQDIILGDIGDDSIQGGNNNDRIDGSVGNDTMAGGSGSDRLTGGAGNDFFFYEVADQGIDTIVDFDSKGDDTFLFTSANFGGLTNDGFSSVILQNENVGSEGLSIADAELIIFEGKFDNVQAVNAALNLQNGSSDRPAFFVYLNGQRNKYVLGYDTSLADDSLPAFELGILQSIEPGEDQISTIIEADDFDFI